MNFTVEQGASAPLDIRNDSSLHLPAGLAFSALAVASFQLAFYFPFCHLLIVVFAYSLFPLATVRTPRFAFYYGFAIGLASYASHLAFFWHIFGAGSIALCCVLAFWLGLFTLIGKLCRARWGALIWAMAAPFVWTGVEFFRSELYYLRFSWLSIGYTFCSPAEMPFVGAAGLYGIGFLVMAWAAFAASLSNITMRFRIIWTAVLLLVTAAAIFPRPARASVARPVTVTGIQLEFPSEPLVKSALNGALKKFPQTSIFVLSEYVFESPVPNSIRDWCRVHHRYLVAGGKAPAPQGKFYDTAFVIDPQGKVAFQQIKCVPVQLMDDGLPATSQQLWRSPWGNFGLAICYDASYSRVTDELIRQGAQALILPTMDAEEWGLPEHQLHARVAPIRAAEYRVPVFRLCSSGISEVIDASGQITSSAPYPGGGDILTGSLRLPDRGRLPPDRWLARICVAATAILVVGLAWCGVRWRHGI